MKQPSLAAETTALIARLTGAPPRDPALWTEALTHGSMSEPRDYQRLEFLGDRVLGLAIAETLHAAESGSEGQLAQRLNALVSREACAGIAREIGLGDHIRLGKQARDDGARDSDNILGDIVESLLGALFVERGYDAARALIRELWAGLLEGGAGERKHPKAALQEWAAGNKRRMPDYRIIERAGPDHELRFTVAVAIHGVGETRATGGSKQEAESRAAAEFMRRFG